MTPERLQEIQELITDGSGDYWENAADEVGTEMFVEIKRLQDVIRQQRDSSFIFHPKYRMYPIGRISQSQAKIIDEANKTFREEWDRETEELVRGESSVH